MTDLLQGVAILVLGIAVIFQALTYGRLRRRIERLEQPKRGL